MQLCQSLINLLLPKDSNLSKTLHYFKKHFQTIKNPISYHHYFNNCYLKILEHSLQICLKHRSDLTVTDNKGYFIEFPMIIQLALFFKRPGFYENLQYRFKRHKKYSDHIEDIPHKKVSRDLTEKKQDFTEMSMILMVLTEI